MDVLIIWCKPLWFSSDWRHRILLVFVINDAFQLASDAAGLSSEKTRLSFSSLFRSPSRRPRRKRRRPSGERSNVKPLKWPMKRKVALLTDEENTKARRYGRGSFSTRAFRSVSPSLVALDRLCTIETEIERLRNRDRHMDGPHGCDNRWCSWSCKWERRVAI